MGRYKDERYRGDSRDKHRESSRERNLDDSNSLENGKEDDNVGGHDSAKKHKKEKKAKKSKKKKKKKDKKKKEKDHSDKEASDSDEREEKEIVDSTEATHEDELQESKNVEVEAK